LRTAQHLDRLQARRIEIGASQSPNPALVLEPIGTSSTVIPTVGLLPTRW